MAGNMRRVGKAKGHQGELSIHLFGPGMTTLHKVGLAGLWMTLQALEDDVDAVARLRQVGGAWERHETSITVRWDGDPTLFFKALFNEAFKIDTHGLLWFPALGTPMDNPDHAVVLQEAILGSFLQHGRTRMADAAQKPQGTVAVQPDEVPLVLTFHRVTRYAHQDGPFSPMSANYLAGWHVPGGAVRHVGLGQDRTALQEPPERVLALRFAPIGAIYFEIRRRGGGVRPHYALVLPDISHLEWYARARGSFLKYGAQRLYAAGTAEAGFRVLAELQASGLSGDIGSAFCRVISFGTVPWSLQQKTRVDMYTVRVNSAHALRTFALCQQLWAPRLVRLENREPFWDVPQMPDLIARNLAEHREWWVGFADFIADAERRDHVLGYRRHKTTKRITQIALGEKGGLAHMLEDREAFHHDPEQAFVMACHEAWRRRLGQLGDRARRERTSFPDLANREFERVRVAFSRCKNAASLREVVTDFWARAGGSLAPLQASWTAVLPLLDEQHWRKGKDLALLALASYKPVTQDEAEALTSAETASPEGEN
jgi:CRISPR-associated protein Cas8a1/Csx13